MGRTVVSLVLRCLADCRGFWPVWLRPAVVVLLTVPLLFVMPLVERRLIDDVLLRGQFDLLAPTVAVYGGVWLAVAALQIGGAPLRAYLEGRIGQELRRRLFVKCEQLSLAFSHREHSGRTMALFTSDIPAVAGFLSTTSVVLVGNVASLLVGAAVMFSLNWQLSILIIVAPPIVAAAAAVLTRPLRGLSLELQAKNAELSERLHEVLAGLREVVAFGQERAQEARFVATLTGLLRLQVRASLVSSGIGVGQRLFHLVVRLVIFGVGGYLVLIGHTTVGTLIAMERIFVQVYEPSLNLVGVASRFHQILASVERIYEILDRRPQVEERPGARPPVHLEGTVTFEDVTFAYEGDRPALHRVSFAARAGQMIALVGPSGAGKTTVTSLIARFYDPTAGRVLLDGVDLRDMTLSGLRDQIGVVFQDTFLFAATIRENIALGRAGAVDADIIAAARAANAWEFIEHLPRGLDTYVGQRGVLLSEGQKQRLAIARALLRDPKILILDEPTASLDARSEYLLQSALERLVRERTTFVIAHRLATVRRADRILVLDGGYLVEVGTHDELIAQHGVYAELFALQVGTPDPRPEPTERGSATPLAPL